MIVDAILTVLTAPFVWLLDNLPTFTWPDWLSSCTESCGTSGTTMGGYASDLGQKLAALDGWVPVGTLFTAGSLIAAAWAFAFAVRGIRFAVSTFTGGGGAT